MITRAPSRVFLIAQEAALTRRVDTLDEAEIYWL